MNTPNKLTLLRIIIAPIFMIFFTIDDFQRYKRARVQLHGKGIVLRDEVVGAEVKTKEQQAARTGDFSLIKNV